MADFILGGRYARHRFLVIHGFARLLFVASEVPILHRVVALKVPDHYECDLGSPAPYILGLGTNILTRFAK